MKGENGVGRRVVRFQEGREWRLSGILYADVLVLCGESEEDLRVIVGYFVGVCRRGLKVNAGNSKVMVLGGEGELECEVCVDRIRLQHISNLNIWDVFWTNLVHMRTWRKVESGRGVADAISSLVNNRGFQLECPRVLYESLLMAVLMCGSETMIWKEIERSRIMAVQM